jgi:c-di-GMP-binding flagellar brake protein YcgR
MSQDKRKNPRIAFLLQVMIMGQPGLQEIKDFSLGGLFIKVKEPSQFKEGDKIDLVMKLPEENNSTRIKARVVRVTTEGIGVEFEDLPPKDAMALEYCFHVFKHTVPIPGR